MGIAVGVEFAYDVALASGAPARLWMSSRQLSSAPPSPARSSKTVIVQVPFGFSPLKAASASSGTSGVAVWLFAYSVSVRTPSLVV